MLGKSLIFSTILLLFVGCASKVVDQEQRDTTGKFDGDWMLAAQLKKQIVMITGTDTRWRLRCPDESFSFPIRINDGRVASQVGSGEEGYVTEDGTFYANWQLSGTRTLHMSEDSRLIFSGSLEESSGNGKLVYTHDHPSQGCNGTFTLLKQ